MDKNHVKMGIVGLGGRGYSMMLGEWMLAPEVEITAVCDVYEDRVQAAVDAVRERTGKEPFGTLKYSEMLDKNLVDAVYIATDWATHVEIAVAAMRAGVAVAMEVGGASNLQECYDLVNTWKETKTPFMMMENCCFGDQEMIVTAMAKDGVFGKIVHCAGSYAHDLRGEVSNGRVNRHYRLEQYKNHNRENYPTHELGPIAKILGINEGNRFVSLTSVASMAAGLRQYIDDGKCNDPEQKDTQFKQGDVVTTMLTCANGETVLLRLDTTLPRYYDRGLVVRGTKGMYEMTPNMVFLDGQESGFDYRNNIGNLSQYSEKYFPAEWRVDLTGHGHGGMDGVEVRAFLDALENGTKMPVDVYDAAVWMAVTPLSEQSIAAGGAKIDFPEF